MMVADCYCSLCSYPLCAGHALPCSGKGVSGPCQAVEKGLRRRWPPSGHEFQAADLDKERRDLQDSHSSSSTALEQGASIAAPTLHSRSSLTQTAADRAGQIAEHSRARLDLLTDQGMSLLRRTMPLPCMEVSRRSALRMRVQWHGFTWPPVKPEVLRTCEVYL